VVKKKIDPNTLSPSEKGASQYSINCRLEKKKPKKIVINIPYSLFSQSIPKIAQCLHVTVTPEPSKIIEFNKGTEQGLNTITLTGGQIPPISIVGTSLLWKNPQKNLKKNITSDTINKMNPIFKPILVVLECKPW